MPRYYFHLHYRGQVRDLDGVELSGDREAWQQATRACGEMIRDLDSDFEPGPEWRLEVTDSEAHAVLAIHFYGEMFRNGS